MAEIGVPIDSASREETGALLQAALVDLLTLSLDGKQLHWHVTGRHFVPLHEQLDLVVTDARAWADLVAERAVTLGHPVDGRARTVSETSAVTPVPDGFLDDDKVVAVTIQQLREVVERLRSGVDRLGDLDPVTQDLVIEVLRGLEKHLWMFQAQYG